METVKLWFETFGDPKGIPLIILHGFFASSRNWRMVAKELAIHRCVYTVDLRNHGESPHHTLMDYPSMAADLLKLMDEHNLTTINLLGHSMGGKVAMWLALNHPERIESLMVADIAPVSYQHSFDNLINALRSLPLTMIANRKQAEVFLADSIPDLNYRQFLLQNLLLKDNQYQWRINLDVFQKMAANIVAFPDTQHLQSFLGNALFIAGADSGYVKAENIINLFPGAQLKYVANAGHWLHVQQPAAFIEQLNHFLA